MGEAKNPGPETDYKHKETNAGDWADQALDKSNDAMWIVTQNISSLYTSAERHTATKADVYAWQEVEVPRDE